MARTEQNNGKALVLLAMIIGALLLLGCQKVEKPSREGKGPMTIVIEVDDAPDSHVTNMTLEGDVLKNPYEKIPVVGKIFRSSLKGLDFWKANHPNLVTDLHDPALKADPDETCLDCHDQETSCNNCHGYVGVKLVTSSE